MSPWQWMSQSEHGLWLQRALQQQDGCFDGHFPEQPLLPGVWQLHWVMQCWAEAQPQAQLITVAQIKFLQPIKPPCELRLELSWQLERLTFRYYLKDQVCSTGQLVFDQALNPNLEWLFNLQNAHRSAS